MPATEDPLTGDPLTGDPWAGVRSELTTTGLDEGSLPSDPFRLFDEWLGFAFEVGIFNANSMALATVDEQGRPSVRNVLARPAPADDDAVRGVAFYTDENSRKGIDLAANPNAAALFSWLPLERQVRMSGRVERLGRAAVADYFAGRPRDAQIAMTASDQSARTPDRAAVEARFAAVGTQAGTAEPAVPRHWHGYLLVPRRIEFWQGRADRIHDRLVYHLAPLDGFGPKPAAAGAWTISRLQP